MLASRVLYSSLVCLSGLDSNDSTHLCYANDDECDDGVCQKGSHHLDVEDNPYGLNGRPDRLNVFFRKGHYLGEDPHRVCFDCSFESAEAEDRMDSHPSAHDHGARPHMVSSRECDRVRGTNRHRHSKDAHDD